MPPEDVELRKQLLAEIEASIEKYRSHRRNMTLFYALVLLAVTISGVFTTSAGSMTTDQPWFASALALKIWGMISAVGAITLQHFNPAQRAEVSEQKKDAMRAISTAVKYNDLSLSVAATLMETARRDPSEALKELTPKKTG